MASKRIFVDTSGFYSLLVSNDTHHEAALKFLKEVSRKSYKLITTDYVIDETVTLLKARRVAVQIGRLFEILDESAFISVEWVGPERFGKAREYLERHMHHDYSFTDTASFVVMRELRIESALTADHHFQEAGFSVLLG